MEINNALMDYPLEWRQVFVTVFFYDIILKFSKTVTLGFCWFFSQEKLGDADQIFFR